MYVKCAKNAQLKDEDKLLEALGLRRIHPSINLSNSKERKEFCIDKNTDETILETLGLRRIHPSLNIINVKSSVNIKPNHKNKLSKKQKKTVQYQKKVENNKNFVKKGNELIQKSNKDVIQFVKETNFDNGNCKKKNKEPIITDQNAEIAENVPTFEFVKVEEEKIENNNDSQLRNKNVKLLKQKKIDGKTKYIICRICSKPFTSVTTLKSHHDEIHLSKKPYCCSKCDGRFIGLEELIAHTRIHAGKMPYTCKICKENFNDKTQYRKHLTVHELKKLPTVKKVSCEDCGKAFSKMCDLERHRRVHTGEKPFACMICNKRFQQAHNLTKHLLVHTREKQYQCEICNKIFSRSDVLRRHMLIHSVHKPFTCNFCEKSFNRNAQLTAHIERRHPQKIDSLE